jgi:subtilisin family serine protease
MGKRDQATPFWICNDISLQKAYLETVVTLAKLKEDFVIRESEDVSIQEQEDIQEGVNNAEIQWGLEKIEGHKVWKNTTRGEGITVGIIDSGVRGDHEALQSNFAGAWFDPYYNESRPTDLMGQGTHSAGIILGTEKGIGVAPGLYIFKIYKFLKDFNDY